MVAQRDPKRQSDLAWSSFEHSRGGQEIMIDDDHHHIGGNFTCGFIGVLHNLEMDWMADETLKIPVG